MRNYETRGLLGLGILCRRRMVSKSMALQIFQRDKSQRFFVCALQYHLRCTACIQSLFPARSAQTPTVAGLESGEIKLWHGCREVVSAGTAKSKEIQCQHDTNGVNTSVVCASIAAASSVIPRQRSKRAGEKLCAQDILGMKSDANSHDVVWRKWWEKCVGSCKRRSTRFFRGEHQAECTCT